MLPDPLETVQDCRAVIEGLELRLKHRTEQLEAANKELEAFSYSVSHDLRAPLRSMDGFSQALLEDYQDRLDETGQGYLTRIRAAAQRMGGLIDDLLKLSRTCRGDLVLADCDLSRIASKAAADLAGAHPESACQVSIQPGLTVRADANLMRAALEQLLGNAWKFSARVPDPRIEVGAEDGPGGERIYFVRDHGCGFDMAFADKLFNPFQRLHAASEYPGSGIGLAIVQRIIRRHGGQIWAQAEPGAGAVFSFTLP